MSGVTLRGIDKSFPRRDGTALTVLRDVSLDVPERAIVALVGESGCGKSTLLNIIAGLVAPDRGTIRLGTDERVDRSAMTYMFQEDRLLPWRTAAGNVAFGLEAGPVSARQRRDKVAAALALVGLSDFAGSYPHELSGGMRSRAALARSIVTEPKLLLMDEPFSKLDPTIRGQMHAELLRIVAGRAMSVVFVTHDVEEAVVLADTVVVMRPRPGRIGEVRAIDLPRPRDPVAPDVAEAVRRLRLSLIGDPAPALREAV